MSDASRMSPLVIFKGELEKRRKEFHGKLPANMPVERFLGVCNIAVANNPDLLKCDPRSLWMAFMRCATDGLLPDGREASVHPYAGKATYVPMVAGIRKKARNSGEIKKWEAQIICENDQFDYTLGDDSAIYHKAPLDDRGEIIGAYSICHLMNGEISREVMGIKEIHGIRDRSAAWKFKGVKSPWGTDEGEMCKKTVVKRHAKSLPVSADLSGMLNEGDEEEQPKRLGRPPKQSFTPSWELNYAKDEGGKSDPRLPPP